MAGIVPQNYDFVTTNKDPILKFFDYGTLDGDAVQVKFNGQVLKNRIDLAGPSASAPVRLDLRTGINTLEVTALNVGTVANNTVGIDFPAGTVIYEKDGSGGYKDSSTGRFTAALPEAGTTYRLDFGLPLVRVDGTRFPEAAQHIIDTLKQPRIQTLDRLNAEARRENNVGRYIRLNGDRAPARFGFQIDEAPPAVLLENGFANTTRPIPSKDNQGVGGNISQQINNYRPQKKTLPNGANVDFFSTSAPASRRVNGTEQDDTLTGTFGIDNLIYGLAGDDVLSGAPTNEPGSGNNTLFGGPRSDTLFGRAGDDLLLGQSDNDFLYGGPGSDVLYGGKGNDPG